MKITGRDIIMAVLSGILGAVAFPPAGLSVAAWVSMVPVLFSLKKDSPRSNFIIFYLAGLVFFGMMFYWLVNVSVPGTIILVLVLSLFFGIFGVCSGLVVKYSYNLLIIPFFWVVLEYIRGNLFTGFPWGLLGYSQYRNIQLIQIADVTGAYGVSFMVMMFNTAAFSMLTRSAKKTTYMAAALFMILLSSIYSAQKLDTFFMSGKADISVIQGNVPQRFKWDSSFAREIMEGYTGLTRQAAKDKADLIVWPETSYPYAFYRKTNPAPEVQALSSEAGIPILAGVVLMKDGVAYNSAALFEPSGTKEKVYSKTHLVPFGEYIPFRKLLFFIRDMVDKPIGDFGRGDDFTLFKIKTMTSTETSGVKTRLTSFYRFGVMICFEDVFPYIAREYVRGGANFLVNITNDAWFGKTAEPTQHLQSSVFRAVENRVPVIRAANTGVSCFIDATGKIYSEVMSDDGNIFIKGYVTDSMDIPAVRSVYTTYGDMFVLFCGLVSVLIIGIETLIRGRSIRGRKQTKQ